MLRDDWPAEWAPWLCPAEPRAPPPLFDDGKAQIVDRSDRGCLGDVDDDADEEEEEAIMDTVTVGAPLDGPKSIHASSALVRGPSFFVIHPTLPSLDAFQS